MMRKDKNFGSNSICAAYFFWYLLKKSKKSLIKHFSVINSRNAKMEEESRKRRETNDLCDHDADGWPAEDCVRLGIIVS